MTSIEIPNLIDLTDKMDSGRSSGSSLSGQEISDFSPRVSSSSENSEVDLVHHDKELTDTHQLNALEIGSCQLNTLENCSNIKSASSDIHKIIQNDWSNTTSKYDLQHPLLHILEPSPAYPPDYDTLPPGGCPKFPVSPPTPTAKIPGYTPSVYKCGIVCRKVEWLTPYEPCPSRSWKYTIMELNSTQLNFYVVPSTLEQSLLSFEPCLPTEDNRRYSDFGKQELRDHNSGLTSDSDLQFYKFCQKLNLLNEPERSISSNSKRMIRSYSLQHCKLGLAVDYKKRPNVLRVRIESEQILLHFPNIRELVEWNTAIGVGRDVALDLEDRILPRFRTVPRRRRNTTSEANNSGRNRSTSLSNSNYSESAALDSSANQTMFYIGENNTRMRSDSEPASKLRGKLSKLKSRFGRPVRVESYSKLQEVFPVAQPSTLPLKSSPLIGTSSSSSGFSTPTAAEIPIAESKEASVEEPVYSSTPEPTSNIPPPPIVAALRPTRSTSAPNLSILSPRRQRANTAVTIDDEEDIQEMSDFHRSDEEEEEEEEDDDEDNEHDDTGEEVNRISRFTNYKTSTAKWNPGPDRIYTERKFYRNCLRCIKPLVQEDAWVSRSIVKPTSMSPFHFAYLKNVKDVSGTETPNSFGSFGAVASSSTLSQFFSSSSSTSLASMNSTGSSRSRNKSDTGISSGFTAPESILTKFPGHFVKEYTVGPHGLVPKMV